MVRDARRSELLRKLIHVAMGLVALSLRWLTPIQAFALAGSALAFNLWVIHPLTGGRLLRPEERTLRFSWGIVLYPAVVLGSLLVFHDRMELAAGTWALLAFGDGMAAICGPGSGVRKCSRGSSVTMRRRRSCATS